MNSKINILDILGNCFHGPQMPFAVEVEFLLLFGQEFVLCTSWLAGLQNESTN